MARVNDGRMTGGGLARGHGVSVWRQIADAIGAEIAAGGIPPGAQVPTEAVLAERYGVNRHTVRRALAALAEGGLLRATRGRGTFVEPRPLLYPIGPRTRFSEIVGRSGREPGGRVLSCEEEPASPIVARALAVGEGASVLRLEILRSADGVPIARSTSHLPLPRFTGFDAGDGLSAAFARHGVADYRRATTRITTVLAPPALAAALDLAPGRPVLVVESVNTDPAGTPVQATTASFAGDRVEIVVDT